MSELRKALKEYLAVRRALGFKLKDDGALLHRFVDFAEKEGALFITRDLALRWSILPKDCQPARWADRLGMIRLFAKYRSAADPRTEIPPEGLLPHRFHRKPPYIYSDEQIVRLIQAAEQLSSPLGLRAVTFSTLLGLLAVTVLRGKLIQEENSTIGQVPWNSVHQKPFPGFRSILADFAVSQHTENRGAAIFIPTENSPGGFCRSEFAKDDFVPSLPIP